MKNKTKEDIKSWVLRWIFFLITVFTGGIIYAAIWSTWTAPSTLEVGAGSGLTATSWNQLLANFNNLNNTVSGLGTIPTGIVVAYNGTSCPSWWTEASWSSVPMWAGGISTLNLRGEFIRGLDNGRGIDVGRALGSAQTDMLKSHAHDFLSMWNENGWWSAQVTNNYSFSWYTGWSTHTTVATGGSETRPRNVALLYCVKN